MYLAKCKQTNFLKRKCKSIVVFVLMFCLSMPANAQQKSKVEIVLDSLLAKNKNAEAILYLKKEIAIKPTNDKLYRNLGFVYLNSNDLINAEIQYKKAISLNKACGRCYMHLARIYAIKNESEKALISINKSISIDDSDASAYCIKANIYEMQNDEIGAMSNYDKAIEIAPQEAEYYYARAMFNNNHAYKSFAMSDITKAIDVDANNDNYYYYRSEIYFGLGKINNALEDVDRAIKINNRVATYYIAKAAIQYALKNNDEVIANYRKAIEVDTNSYYAYFNLGGEYYRQENMDSTCILMNKSIEIISKNKIDAKEKSEIENILKSICDASKPSYYYHRGIGLYNIHKMQESIDWYNQGIAKFPNHALLLSFRGNALIKSKKFKECIADYEKAIENRKNLAEEIEFNKSTGRPISDQYEEELVASSYSSMAEAYLVLGNYDKAMKAINQSLAIKTENAIVGKENYYRLKAEICIADNNLADAMLNLDTSLQLNASHVPSLISKAAALIYKLNDFKSNSIGFNNYVDKPLTAKWNLPLKQDKKYSKTIFDAAMYCVQKAVEIEPENADAFYVRGILHYMNFENNAYCADIQKAKLYGREITDDFEKICK
jgi:tetratricopeptide (TPR) repeat protein